MHSFPISKQDIRTNNPLKRSLFVAHSKDQNGKPKKMPHLDYSLNTNHPDTACKATPCKSQTFSQITTSSVYENTKYIQKNNFTQKSLMNVFNSNLKQNLVQNLFEKPNFQEKINKQNFQRRVQSEKKLQPLEATKKSVQLSQNHQYLIKVQCKLDQTLDFLKQNRRKSKGQFFSVIKKIILESNNMCIQCQHIKKIMFIDDLYIVKKQKVQSENNFMISMKDGKGTLQERRQNFRSKLTIFIQNNQNPIQQKEKPVQIPQLRLAFEKILNLTSQLDSKKSVIKINNQKGQSKLGNKADKMWIFKKKSNEYKLQLLQNLQKKIIERQKLIQSQKQLKALAGKKQKVAKKQLYQIVQEIQLVFLTKNISNIILTELVQYLGNKLLISNEIINQIIKKILNICQKNNCRFLAQIQHKQQKVIQIDKNLLNQMKIYIKETQQVVLKLDKLEQTQQKNSNK